MKGINIFLVLLISVFFISNVSAVSHTGDVDVQISISASDFQLANGTEWGVGSIAIEDFWYKGVADAGYPDTIIYHDATISKEAAYAWVDIPQSVGGSFVLSNAGVFAGTGTIRILRVNHVDVGRVDIIYTFKSNPIDFVPSDTEVHYDVSVYGSALSEYYAGFSFQQGSHSYYTHNCEFRLKSGSYLGIHPEWDPEAGYVEYDYAGHFINEYNITLSGATAITNITRDGLGQQLSSSRLFLRDYSGSVAYLPSSYSTINSTYYHDNGLYWYYIDVENYGNVLIHDATEGYAGEPCTIELNQTSYTEPDIIQINATLASSDSSKVFTVRLFGDVYGWGALTHVEYNESTVMETPTKNITCELDKTFYDYPLEIKGVLIEYNKTTSVTTHICETDPVYYNPPDAGDYIFEGSVIDAGNFGVIPGATVSVTGTISQSDITDSNGKFRLYLPNGIYTVTGSMAGYVDNVNEDIVIAGNISYYNIYLTQTSYTNGTMNGIITDINTGSALQDVHLIFTNDTDTIDAYSQATGYYDIGGFAQSSTYNISALKSGYHTYTGSVTTQASGGTTKSFSMVPVTPTPTPTPTIIPTEIPTIPTPLPTTVYPGGEGYPWTNEDIVTMLRVTIPGFFLLMLVFLLLAVMLGIFGNNGNGGQGRSGLSELWRRY